MMTSVKRLFLYILSCFFIAILFVLVVVLLRHMLSNKSNGNIKHNDHYVRVCAFDTITNKPLEASYTIVPSQSIPQIGKDQKSALISAKFEAAPDGYIVIRWIGDSNKITISKDGYRSKILEIPISSNNSVFSQKVYLDPINPSKNPDPSKTKTRNIR